MALVKFRLRRDSAADWASLNPVLGLGEPALTTGINRVKYGDGATAWAAIPYPTIPSTDVTGLGTAATQNTGTSGANIPLLNGSNVWSAQQLLTSLRINATGTDLSIAFGSFTPIFQQYGTSIGASSIGLTTFQNNANGPTIFLAKSRDALGVYTTPAASGDVLGQFSYYGSDGTSLANGALFEVRSGSAFSASNRESYFQWRAQPSGATGTMPVIAQLRATDFRPGSDNAQTLGTAAIRWSDVRAVLGTFDGLVSGAAGFQHGSFTIAGLPSAASFPRTSVYCSDLGGGGGIVASDGAAWRRPGHGGYTAIASDGGATFTYTYLTRAPTIRQTTAITANRTVTLTAGAPSGARARFVRDVAATGAFNWSIGGLKNLAAGTWCDIESDGTNWFLSAYGTL